MKRQLDFVAIVITALSVYEGSCFGQAPQRTIRYNANVPIASRLLPGDGIVEVVKYFLPPLIIERSTTESFDQLIRRLAQYDTIAIVRVSAAGGELIENGTWIQTRVRAEVSRASGAGVAKTPGSVLEFTYDGGTTRIDAVTVFAGLFPVFVQNDQYLVFLYTDSTPRGPFFGMAYHVNAQGLLEPQKTNGGQDAEYETTLVGRGISEVMDAFSRAK